MTAEDTTYNGWSNRATWNVSLWLNNDEGLYHDLQRIVRRATSVDDLAEAIEAYCRDTWQEGKTPDGDSLDACDFEEIAQGEYDEANPPQEEGEEEPEPADALTRFAADNGIGFTRQWIPSRPDRLMDSMTRHFKCRITKGKRGFTIYFSQGSGHTEPPTLSDVLDCLASDASTYDNASTFEDWASDLGYDPDSRSAEKTYKATKRQSEQLKRVLGREVYDRLLNMERL